MSALPSRIDLTAFNNLTRMVLNNMTIDRAALIHRGTDPRRDFYSELGYPKTVGVDNYQDMYDRGDVGFRVINVYPEETWAVSPELYENERKRMTRFESAFQTLVDEMALWAYANRVDELSGIGSFGVLLLGFNDGNSMETCLPGINPKTGERVGDKNHKLLFMRPFEQQFVNITKVEMDPTSPRFGQPMLYDIRVANPEAVQTSSEQFAMVTMTVHWSRVIHMADNRKSSESFGVPRLQAVYNRVLDLHKVTGGSAEMFWRGAFPGYSFETYPELSLTAQLDEDSVKAQMDEYANGLKRYIALVGMKANSLAPQIADPTAHIEKQISIICSAIGVPMRIFMGSESGHLASSQDAITWNRRLQRRQDQYVNPFVIRPLVNRLIAAGVLPTPSSGTYKIAWSDLNSMSETEKADTAVKRTQSLLQYVSSGAETVIPVFEYLTMILNLSYEEATAVTEALAKQTGELSTEKVWGAMNAGPAGQGGGDPAAKTGAMGKRNAQAKK